MRCKTKAIGAQHDPWVKDAMLPHHAIMAHVNAGMQSGVCANAGASLDHTQRSNVGCWINKGGRINHRSRVDARPLRQRVMGAPQLGQSGKVMVGVGCNDTSATALGGRCQSWRHNHTGCSGAEQLGLVFGMTEKTQIFGTGRPQRCQAINPGLGVAMQVTAQGCGDLT